MRTPPKMTMIKGNGCINLFLDGVSSGVVRFVWWGNDINIAWADLIPHKSLTGIHSGFHVNVDEGDCEDQQVASYFEKIELEKEVAMNSNKQNKGGRL